MGKERGWGDTSSDPLCGPPSPRGEGEGCVGDGSEVGGHLIRPAAQATFSSRGRRRGVLGMGRRWGDTSSDPLRGPPSPQGEGKGGRLGWGGGGGTPHPTCCAGHLPLKGKAKGCAWDGAEVGEHLIRPAAQATFPSRGRHRGRNSFGRMEAASEENSGPFRPEFSCSRGWVCTWQFPSALLREGNGVIRRRQASARGAAPDRSFRVQGDGFAHGSFRAPFCAKETV